MKPEVLYAVIDHELRVSGVYGLRSFEVAVLEYKHSLANQDRDDRWRRAREQAFEEAVQVDLRAVQGAVQAFEKTGHVELNIEGAGVAVTLGFRELRGGPVSQVKEAEACRSSAVLGRFLLFQDRATLQEYLRKKVENIEEAERQAKQGRDEAWIAQHQKWPGSELQRMVSCVVDLRELLPVIRRAVTDARREILDQLGVLPSKPILAGLFDWTGYQPVALVSFKEAVD